MQSDDNGTEPPLAKFQLDTRRSPYVSIPSVFIDPWMARLNDDEFRMIMTLCN